MTAVSEGIRWLLEYKVDTNAFGPFWVFHNIIIGLILGCGVARMLSNFSGDASSSRRQHASSSSNTTAEKTEETRLPTKFTGVMRSKLPLIEQRGAVISLNGLCGSGKSAFIDWMERNFGRSIGDTKRMRNARRIFGHSTMDSGKLNHSYTMRSVLGGNIYVYKETPSEIVRENFYANPASEWAWIFQNVQQRKCLEFMVEAQHYAQCEEAICFIDRDLYGNACFEMKHAETGVIPPHLHQTYQALNDSIFESFSPDISVLLDAPVEECVHRLEVRRQTTHESIPDSAYLKELRRAHDKIIGYDEASTTLQYHTDAANPQLYGGKLVRRCPTFEKVGDLEQFHAETLLTLADHVDKMRDINNSATTGRPSLLASM